MCIRDRDREKFVVPKSVQNVIPIKTIWEDGIFLVGRNKYAKTFKFCLLYTSKIPSVRAYLRAAKEVRRGGYYD